MTNENRLRIDGDITPRAERVLRRAVAIANDRGYNYLGVEHLALAIAAEPDSLPARVWDGPLTIKDWHAAIIKDLPELPAERSEPVVITVAHKQPAI